METVTDKPLTRTPPGQRTSDAPPGPKPQDPSDTSIPKTIEKSDKLDETLEKLHKDFESSIGANDKTNKAKPTGVDKNKVGFFERFLHDEWWLRFTFALGNEFAESSEELFRNLLPKFMADTIYRVCWSLAFIATGSRVVMNTVKAPQDKKIKAGVKMLMHDGVAAIGAPTFVARAANYIQNKIYGFLSLPSMLKDILRTTGSMLCCKYAIHWLDPRVMKISGNLLNYKDDHHKSVNAALGSSH